MLALFCGTGDLPQVLGRHLTQIRQPFVTFGFERAAPLRDVAAPHVAFRLETLGTLFADLKAAGVTQVCFAGAATRPEIAPGAIDAATRPLLKDLTAIMAQGDDATLRGILGIFEAQGFDVVAAHRLLPDLLPQAGVLSKTQPSERDKLDVARARGVHDAMASADVGQACVVAEGQVLAVEALPGTDWMLRSLLVETQAPTNAPSSGSIWDDPLGVAADMMGGPVLSQTARVRDPNLPKGGVLFKASKPLQSTVVDLATIGPATVAEAANLGLSGIAIGPLTQVLHLHDVLAACDAAGLFFWVQQP